MCRNGPAAPCIPKIARTYIYLIYIYNDWTHDEESPFRSLVPVYRRLPSVYPTGSSGPTDPDRPFVRLGLGRGRSDAASGGVGPPKESVLS